MEDIQRSASLVPAPSAIKPLVKGLYFARIFYNSLWYRVEVSQVHSSTRFDKQNGRIRFQLVDYGNREFVRTSSPHNFRLIREKTIDEKPYFAFRASLAGVISSNDEFYPRIENLMKDRKFFMKIVKDDGLIKSVNLTYPDGADLATLLFRQGVVELER